MKRRLIVAAGAVLILGVTGCASTPAAAPVTSTVTTVSTAVRTVVSTVVTTLDPVAVSSSAAASKASVAAARASSAASVSSESAAAEAAAGPIYYSVHCSTGGDYVDFPTYKDAWKASPKTDSCSANDTKHGLQMTAALKKALTTAYGPNADPADLSALFGICATVEGYPTTKVGSTEQVNEASGALLLCPDHPNAKKIAANIEAFVNPPPPPPPVQDPLDTITYEITGSASTALVTYSQGSNGGSIGQENDVAVPWSKTLTITGEYRSLAVSAQNGGDGDITCTIKVGGKVVETVTSKGAYAIASCSS